MLVGEEEGTGAALSQPPKSSSAATVGAGLGEGAPQPAPTSFAVKVSGTFIMEAAEGAGAGAAGAGSGSGVLHAFPPQGSMVDEGMLAVTAGVGTVEVSCLGGDGGGGLRLKADFISSWGEVFAIGGGGAAAGAGGGDDRPNKSSDGDEIGGSGFFGGDGCGACGGGGDAKSVKPISCPKDEIEALRD